MNDDDDSVVAFSNVCASIQRNPALSNLSFAVRRGERWAIVGPNGSGKTTLLRLANGYLRPSSGSVSILDGVGGEGQDLRDKRRMVGFVSSYLDTLISPEDNVLDIVVSGRLGATKLWKVPEFQDVQKARRLLRELSCLKFEDRKLSDLSQGERQKILIARALMPDPALLTLDEPCASLDLKAREIFLKGLERIARDRSDLSVIYVTHRIDEVPSCFTHALLLKGGRVVSKGLLSNVITGENLTKCFGVGVEVKRWRNRLYPVVSE